tara:strand:+ start:237 stop:1487 length:1251 start_codon:yes stop_codon:yes gene_type:complete
MKAKLTEKHVKSLLPAEDPYEVRDTELQGFLVRVQPSGSKSFYVDYRLPGKGRTRFRIDSHKKITATSAREVAKRKLAEVAHGKDIQADKKLKRRNVMNRKATTLSGFLEHRYGPWVEQERRTGKATLNRIRSNFPDLLDHPMADISIWLIEKWKAEQRGSGKAGATISRDLVSLKAALSKAVEWEVLESHPLQKLKLEKNDALARVRYLSVDEAQRLRRSLDQREDRLRSKRIRGNVWRTQRGYELLAETDSQKFVDCLKPMVLLSLNTGLRQGEVFDIQWNDIDFSVSQLKIRGETAKANKTRYLPLNDEALDVLKRWRITSASDGHVFPSKKGGRMNNVRKSWSALLTEAGITDFRWHDMRHDFASKLVMAGVDLNTIRELLGHSDIKMTLRYSHLAPEHKAEAVKKLLIVKT